MSNSFHAVKVFGAAYLGANEQRRGQTVSADAWSIPINAPTDAFSVHIVWDGTLSANLRLFYSNLPNPDLSDNTDWVEDTTWSPTDPAGSPGSTLTPVSGVAVRWLRVMIDYSAGSGSVYGYAYLKK